MPSTSQTTRPASRCSTGPSSHRIRGVLGQPLPGYAAPSAGRGGPPCRRPGRSRCPAVDVRGGRRYAPVADITERLPAPVQADSHYLGVAEASTVHAESYVYTDIGDLDAAETAQERALGLYPRPMPGCVRRSSSTAPHASSSPDTSATASGSRPTSSTRSPSQHNGLLYEVARQVVHAVPEAEHCAGIVVHGGTSARRHDQ